MVVKKKPATNKTPPQRAPKKTPEPKETQQPVEETQEDRDAAAAERKEHTMSAKGALPSEEYQPERLELEHAGFDHHGAEERRQDELQRERDVHNARTGDASR